MEESSISRNSYIHLTGHPVVCFDERASNCSNLEGLLWGKMSTADRSAKTLKAFKSRIRTKDLTNLMDTGCNVMFVFFFS